MSRPRGWRRFGLRALIASASALVLVVGGAAAGAVADDPGPVPVDITVDVGNIGTVAAIASWDPVPDAERFVVQLSDGSAPIEVAANPDFNVVQLTGLTAGTAYSAAVEAWGTVSGVDQVVGRGAVDFTTLASFELNGVATGPTTVHLTWDPPLAAEAGLSGDGWGGPLPAGATEFTDHSVLPGHTYSYELLGERVEVPVEIGTMSPVVTATTPTSAGFSWPAVYGGAGGVTGHFPRSVTYTVFVDGVEVGTTEGLTFDLGGLATGGHRMTIEASVVASFYDEDTGVWSENVRVVLARGGVDFITPPTPTAVGPALAASGAGDPLAVILLGAALLIGGATAVVAASARPLTARAGRDRRVSGRG